jgi:hypothetical protein
VRNTLERLREVFLEFSVPTKDALVQLSFTAFQAVNSVRHPGFFFKLATFLIITEDLL